MLRAPAVACTLLAAGSCALQIPIHASAGVEALGQDAPLQLRNGQGVLSINRVGDPADGRYELRWNNHLLATDDNDAAVSIISSSGTDDRRLVVLQFASMGTACPAMYRILDLSTRPEPSLSRSFGNCSDVPKVDNSNGQVALRFPPIGHAAGQRLLYKQSAKGAVQLQKLR